MNQEIKEKILRMYKLGYNAEQLSLIICGVTENDIEKVIKEENEKEILVARIICGAAENIIKEENENE